MRKGFDMEIPRGTSATRNTYTFDLDIPLVSGQQYGRGPNPDDVSAYDSGRPLYSRFARWGNPRPNGTAQFRYSGTNVADRKNRDLCVFDVTTHPHALQRFGFHKNSPLPADSSPGIFSFACRGFPALAAVQGFQSVPVEFHDTSTCRPSPDGLPRDEARLVGRKEDVDRSHLDGLSGASERRALFRIRESFSGTARLKSGAPSTGPGATLFTRMPFGASCLASALVKPTMALLVAA